MKQPQNDTFDFQIIDLEDARKTLNEAPQTAPQSGWVQHEPARPVRAPAPAVAADPLPRQTVRWIVSLPAEARPLHLFKLYPHIGNRLAEYWADPVLAQNFFDQLLMDNRGGRQGFPKEVFDDLMRLQ